MNNLRQHHYSLIVTGDISGRIKFYDSMVRILYWYQSFELKSIRSVSFDLDPRYYELRDPTDFDNGMPLLNKLKLLF